MRKLSLLLMVLAVSLGAAACAGASGQPQAGASEDTCPAVSPGVCPAGCTWNGTECRKQAGVIIFDGRAGDAGADAATQ